MRYRAESHEPPEKVLAAFAALGHARATTWASRYSWSPSRLYCRVEGATFQASIGGGGVLTAAVCTGTVQQRGDGSFISAAFRFGFLPTWAFKALFVACVLASLAMLFSGLLDLNDPTQLALVLGLPAGTGVYCWLKSMSVSLVLSELSDQVGGLTWTTTHSAV